MRLVYLEGGPNDGERRQTYGGDAQIDQPAYFPWQPEYPGNEGLTRDQRAKAFATAKRRGAIAVAWYEATGEETRGEEVYRFVGWRTTSGEEWEKVDALPAL